MRPGFAASSALGSAALLLVLAGQLAAQQDVAGAHDHPAFARAAGSRITNYHVDPQGQCDIPLGAADGRSFTESQKTSGKVTRITYAQQQGRSVGDVYREFSTSFSRAGVKPLFTCSNETCGKGTGPVTSCTGAWDGQNGQRQFTGSTVGTNGAVIISLHVQAPDNVQRAQAVLTVIEVGNGPGNGQGVGAGLVTEISQQLRGRGFVELEGTPFQQGSANFSTQATGVLQDVASYLKQNPTVRVFVVNHTDNEGGWQQALSLSKLRAQAIVQALSSRFGISTGRLSAQGVGPLSPVADIRTESGRSKNTRTVLVAIE